MCPYLTPFGIGTNTLAKTTNIFMLFGGFSQISNPIPPLCLFLKIRIVGDLWFYKLLIICTSHHLLVVDQIERTIGDL